jgi:VCBS repeat-containing protein
MALNASTGVWTYSLNNALVATQALKEGEVVTQTYVARATDNFGAFVEQTLTVSIKGSNDVPVISSGAAQAGAVVSGSFTAGGSNRSCTTGSNGSCSITSGALGKRVSTTTFSVQSINGTNLTYDASQNILTSITLRAP